MKKVILILQWVISVFKIQDSQKITLNSVCWVFDQRSLISKNTFKNWHLFDFISTIRLEYDMIIEIWDLILEQERLSNKKNINQIGKTRDRNDINISGHSLKSWPLGGNTVDPEKENKRHSDQLGAIKDDQMMNQCTEDNGV